MYKDRMYKDRMTERHIFFNDISFNDIFPLMTHPLMTGKGIRLQSMRHKKPSLPTGSEGKRKLKPMP